MLSCSERIRNVFFILEENTRILANFISISNERAKEITAGIGTPWPLRSRDQILTSRDVFPSPLYNV